MPRPPAKRRRRRGVRGVVVRGFVALSKRIGLLDAWGGDFSRRLALCSYRGLSWQGSHTAACMLPYASGVLRCTRFVAGWGRWDRGGLPLPANLSL
jgi:hypothetical protein